MVSSESSESNFPQANPCHACGLCFVNIQNKKRTRSSIRHEAQRSKHVMMMLDLGCDAMTRVPVVKGSFCTSQLPGRRCLPIFACAACWMWAQCTLFLNLVDVWCARSQRSRGRTLPRLLSFRTRKKTNKSKRHMKIYFLTGSSRDYPRTVPAFF